MESNNTQIPPDLPLSVQFNIRRMFDEVDSANEKTLRKYTKDLIVYMHNYKQFVTSEIIKGK